MTRRVVALQRVRTTAGMLLRQVATLSWLRHANIVMLQQVTQLRRRAYLVFEHLPRNLAGVLEKEEASLPGDRALVVAASARAGLAHLHVHGGVMPGAVLLGGPAAKLGGFDRADTRAPTRNEPVGSGRGASAAAAATAPAAGPIRLLLLPGGR